MSHAGTWNYSREFPGEELFPISHVISTDIKQSPSTQIRPYNHPHHLPAKQHSWCHINRGSTKTKVEKKILHCTIFVLDHSFSEANFCLQSLSTSNNPSPRLFVASSGAMLTGTIHHAVTWSPFQSNYFLHAMADLKN